MLTGALFAWPDLNGRWYPSQPARLLAGELASIRIGHCWTEPFQPGEDERQFHIVNVDTETVEVRGVMSPRLRSELGEDQYGFDYSGTDVYELDSSHCSVRVGITCLEGVGRSWTFQVDNALQNAFKALLNGLSASRCDSESELQCCETS